MTFGRSVSGVRVVITPISGALTSGPKKDDAKSTAITPTTGRSSPSSQRGSVSATSDIAPRRTGSWRGTIRIATTLPSTAPAPSAPKNAPATLGLPPNSS